MASTSVPQPDWNEIEALVEDVSDLASSAESEAQFYPVLLQRTIRALRSAAGGVWKHDSGQVVLAVDAGLQNVAFADKTAGETLHQRKIQDVVRHGKTATATCQGAVGESAVGKDADSSSGSLTMTFLPVRVDGETHAVIELISEGQPEREHSDLRDRVASAVCELAADFHRNTQLRSFKQRERHSMDLAHYCARVHGSLSVRRTAFEVANESRRVLSCDRVAVLVQAGKAYRVEGVSGVAEIDRRSNVSRRLVQLVGMIAQVDEPLHYTGDELELPPQLDRSLQHYLDASHAQVLHVVPLRRAEDARPFAAIVAERFDRGSSLESDLNQIAGHASAALGNAIEHETLPFLGVAKWMRHLLSGFGRDVIPTPVKLLLVLAAIVAVLVLVPADFEVAAEGELQPATVRDVFAPHDGEIIELKVSHGDDVARDQVLTVVRSSEIEVEYARVLGEKETTEERLLAAESARLQNDPDEQQRDDAVLTASEEELRRRLNSLNKQLDLLREQRSLREIRSPITGRVLTWDVERLLESRPVRRGQVLLSVGDVNGPWVVELQIPDHRSTQVADARQPGQGELNVRFALASEPKQEYDGTLKTMAKITNVDDRGVARVRAVVEFDRSQLSELRPGTVVSARVSCGERPLGYVWLHDLIDFAWSAIWF